MYQKTPQGNNALTFTRTARLKIYDPHALHLDRPAPAVFIPRPRAVQPGQSLHASAAEAIRVLGWRMGPHLAWRESRRNWPWHQFDQAHYGRLRRSGKFLRSQ